jgi:hypothetical protein
VHRRIATRLGISSGITSDPDTHGTKFPMKPDGLLLTYR